MQTSVGAHSQTSQTAVTNSVAGNSHGRPPLLPSPTNPPLSTNITSVGVGQGSTGGHDWHGRRYYHGTMGQRGARGARGGRGGSQTQHGRGDGARGGGGVQGRGGT